jgi:phosphate-selective porin OprO and OprP
MYKPTLLALMITFSSTLLSAQSSDTKKTTPYFYFKNGLGFAAPDSSFSINVRFRMQNRVLMNTTSEEDLSPASWEARVRRCRLSFTGHVVNPKWNYYLQLSFSRGDMDWNVNDASTQNTSPNVVRDAMIFYRPNAQWQLALGQGKLPGNRQRVVSSGSLQFYDRSPVNGAFTLDRDFGAFVNYTLPTNTKFKTIVKTAITSGEGRNSVASNSGLAYTGRVELLPFGDFTEGGDYFEGDVVREEKPKLSLAAGYHLNDFAVRSQGQLGRDLFEPRSYSAFIADALFKYKGFALSTEYLQRSSDKPLTKNTAGATRNLVVGDGINTQISYCFPSLWEIAARHSLITPQKEVETLMMQVNEVGFGVNKYLAKHKTKVQFNVFSRRERNLATGTAGFRNFFGVFQIELGI